MDVQRLKKAMEREAELLVLFEGRQSGLLEGVRRRSWGDLDRDLEELRRLADQIQRADAERRAELPERQADAAAFARLAANLPLADRVALEQAYHALGLALIRVKGALWRLDHYVGSLMGTLNILLGELLPYRKGRIYSPRGGEQQAPAAPVVVDRKL